MHALFSVFPFPLTIFQLKQRLIGCDIRVSKELQIREINKTLNNEN